MSKHFNSTPNKKDKVIQGVSYEKYNIKYWKENKHSTKCMNNHSNVFKNVTLDLELANIKKSPGFF